jgi:hypothetical protein
MAEVLEASLKTGPKLSLEKRHGDRRCWKNRVGLSGVCEAAALRTQPTREGHTVCHPGWGRELVRWEL